MSTESGASPCRVENAAKLAADSGGEAALCEAIRAAMATQGTPAYRVDVRVLSESMIIAMLTTADGRVLPEQKLASSDRPLSIASFERFGRTLAAQLAEFSAGR